MERGSIFVGVGGWDYDPWRETFYPPGLPRAKQLGYLAARLTAVEINATYYKLQNADLFRRWAEAVPDGFRFAIKGSRFCTNRKVLGEAGESVGRFCAQGLTALGDKLGPILWQFMATKRFEPADFAAFLRLLPREIEGRPLRHAVEPRHESFRSSAFLDMASEAGVAAVFADSAEYPCCGGLTADFVYARLQRSRDEEPTGYSPAELDQWADRAGGWAGGGRDVYLFFISGAKARNPAAAQALIDRL